MTRQVIKGNLVLPEKVAEDGLLFIEDGRIVEILEASVAGDLPDSPAIIDYHGFWVTPGLIDVHLHG
ncbi:MAG TPA: N-acetylglucosamine-6-phosphate deacetylase, partial [Candidatus Saccharicenans sp.]|nr:N-acetylglucosamine-6-phosphate deacetylase [Candidatus Saccharicenans sp.]